MRTGWAALGIILLMSSILIVVLASLGYQKTEVNWDVPASTGSIPNKWSVSDSWNISGTLNKDDFFKVEIYAAQDWSNLMEPIGTYDAPFKASFVNITDPFGAETELECDFLKLSTSSTNPLVFYNISGTGGPNGTKVEPHGIGTIRFEIPYGNNRPGIVAQALSSGTYWVNMTWLEFGGSPPFTMTLSRGVIVTTKVDYISLYPVGLGVFAVGGVSLVYGFKGPKKTVQKRRAKRR